MSIRWVGRGGIKSKFWKIIIGGKSRYEMISHVWTIKTFKFFIIRVTSSGCKGGNRVITPPLNLLYTNVLHYDL